MEINLFDEVTGVMPVEDIVEGRFVLYTSHGFSNDFGSDTDLPGVKLPDTDEEAKRARYCLTWKVDNRQTPIYAVPSMSFAERGGWSQAANAPFSTTVYLTHPGNQEGLTIPSGTSSLAYTDGVFTIPSGGYIYNANLEIPGSLVIVANTATDTAGEAGKLKYQATNVVGVIGKVRFYNSTTGALTVEVD